MIMTKLEYYCNKNRTKEIRYEYDDPWEDDQEFQLLCYERGFKRAFNTPKDLFAPEIKEFSDFEKMHCCPLENETETSDTKCRKRLQELEALPAGARVAELKQALESVSILMAILKADLFLPRTKQWIMSELRKS